MNIEKEQVCGVILAGGRSSRMNFENKALLSLQGRSLIEHVKDRAIHQVDKLLINANRDIESLEALDLPVSADPYGHEAGPLAGILTGMQWCRNNAPSALALACFPADVPFFPDNVVERLREGMNTESTQVAWLSTNGQMQPLFSLWSLELEIVLKEAIQSGLYSPMALILSLSNSVVSFTDYLPGYFDNLNTPADLRRANTIAEHRSISL